VDVLSDRLKGKIEEIYVIGDAKKTVKARDAMEQAREVGRRI
jgi:hypothetical protein